jgi:hypothetical protein
MKCIKYGPPPTGTTALRTCECDWCSIPTREDQERLREQVTRALIYMQNKENYELNKIRNKLEKKKK